MCAWCSSCDEVHEGTRDVTTSGESVFGSASCEVDSVEWSGALKVFACEVSV